MAKEKIKCGNCGKENWVDPWSVTSCTKCGSPIKGTKKQISLSEKQIRTPVEIETGEKGHFICMYQGM